MAGARRDTERNWVTIVKLIVNYELTKVFINISLDDNENDDKTASNRKKRKSILKFIKVRLRNM